MRRRLSAVLRGVRRIDDLAYVAGLVLGLIVLAASGFLDRSADVVHHDDFSGFWAGPRALLTGIDPYDPRTWREAAIALGTQTPDTPVYGYFGWAIVLLLPLAALPLEIASAIWTFGGMALAALAMRALLRACVPGNPVIHTLVAFALVASQPARLTVLLGQWGFVLVAALAAGVVWARSGNHFGAGIVTLALFGKPHLFVLSAPALAVWSWSRGRRRFVLGALVASVALVTASLAILPQWPSVWLREMPSHRLFDPPQTTTLAAMLSGLLGPSGPWLAFGAILGAALILLRFRPPGDAFLAGWLSLSSVAAPYTWSYDHLLLLVPLVVAAGVCERRSRTISTALVVAVCVMLLVVSTLLAVVAAVRNLESYAAIVPTIAFVLITAAVWPSWRD